MSLSFFLLVSFIAIFQVLQCAFFIFTFFSVSRHFPCPTVCVSNFPRFSVFSPYRRSYTGHFSFSRFLSGSCHVPCQTVFVYHFRHFQFSLHIPCPTVYNSHFSRFLVFLAIFQVIQCLCLIFHVFVFYRHITGPTVCISHFSCFSLFLPIFQVLLCVSHFPRFSVCLATF